MVRCGNCGVENDQDAKYCTNCGNELDGGIQQGSTGGTQAWKGEDSDETGTQVWGDQESKEDAEEFFEEGNKAYGLGKYDDAIKCYERTTSIDPNYAKAWQKKGLAHRMKGETDEAIKCYDKAISIDSDYALAWKNKGYAYKHKGKMNKAKRCWEKSLSIEPDQPSIKDKLDKLK